LISNNFTVSVVCSGVSVAVISLAFITTRPQIFTYLFLMAELYLLESYIKTQKVLPLFFLPLISLALINFHSSMWPMMFIFMAPYIANAQPINTKKIRQQACCRLVPLLFAVAVVLQSDLSIRTDLRQWCISLILTAIQQSTAALWK
jgi:hypothetical protein